MSDATSSPLTGTATSLVLLGMQNDLMHEQGALFNPDLARHAASQGLIENLTALRRAVRDAGGAVVHVLQVVEPECRGQRLNAPVFSVLAERSAVVRGSWGAEPWVPLEPADGDFVVTKQRMNGFYASRLEHLLRGLGTQTLICAGAMTNTAVEHTARHAADLGFDVVVPHDGTAATNQDWQRASLDFGMPKVADVTDTRTLVNELDKAPA